MRDQAKRTPEQLAKEAKKWIASKKGQNTLRKSLQENDRVIQRLRESRQIDQSTLKKVFTI